MTQSHLIVTEEGLKIYKDDPSSAILCEDQKWARKYICDHYTYLEKIGSIYPVPGIEFDEIPCCADDSCPFDANCDPCKKPIKIARLIEHTAEKESATGFTGKVVGDMVWDKEKNDFKIVKSESPEIDKGLPIGVRKIEEYQSQFDESDAQYRVIENLIQWLIDESKKQNP